MFHVCVCIYSDTGVVFQVCEKSASHEVSQVCVRAARTSQQGALLPGLLQQQDVLQQGGVVAVAVGGLRGLRLPLGKAHGQGGAADELARQSPALAHGLDGLELRLLLGRQLLGGLGRGRWEEGG